MSLKKVDGDDLGLHEAEEGILLGVPGLYLPQGMVERGLKGGQWQEGLQLLASLAQESLPPRIGDKTYKPTQVVRTDQCQFSLGSWCCSHSEQLTLL